MSSVFSKKNSGILILILFGLSKVSVSGTSNQDTLDYYKKEPILISKYEDSIPVGFKYFISTPVCGDGECKLAKMLLHFNAIGEFENFDTISGFPLTKYEHEPFTEENYEKLQKILSNNNSILAHFTIEELIRKDDSNGIDGTSGATISIAKEQLVEGAAYTCHTLYSIIYKNLIDTIQKTLIEKADSGFITFYLSHDKPSFQYFGLDILRKRPAISKNFTEILLILLESNYSGILTRSLSLIPDSALNNSKVQNKLFRSALDSPSYTRTLKLIKLQKCPTLNDQLINEIADNTREETALTSMMFNILEKQSKLTPYALKVLSQNTNKPNEIISERSAQLLNMINNAESKQVRGKMKNDF